MKKEAYEKIAAITGENDILRGLVVWSDRILTKISYIAYPLLIAVLAVRRDPDTVRAVMVPAVSFAAVSIFRYLYCAPRPYEVMGIDPLIKKETKGKSFPSRHVFSAFMIAFVFFRFLPAAGIVLGILALVMAAARVLGGVHFVKDVVAGAAIGILCGIIGFCIL